MNAPVSGDNLLPENPKKPGGRPRGETRTVIDGAFLQRRKQFREEDLRARIHGANLITDILKCIREPVANEFDLSVKRAKQEWRFKLLNKLVGDRKQVEMSGTLSLEAMVAAAWSEPLRPLPWEQSRSDGDGDDGGRTIDGEASTE